MMLVEVLIYDLDRFVFYQGSEESQAHLAVNLLIDFHLIAGGLEI